MDESWESNVQELTDISKNRVSKKKHLMMMRREEERERWYEKEWKNRKEMKKEGWERSVIEMRGWNEWMNDSFFSTFPPSSFTFSHSLSLFISWSSISFFQVFFSFHFSCCSFFHSLNYFEVVSSFSTSFISFLLHQHFKRCSFTRSLSGKKKCFTFKNSKEWRECCKRWYTLLFPSFTISLSLLSLSLCPNLSKSLERGKSTEFVCLEEEGGRQAVCWNRHSISVIIFLECFLTCSDIIAGITTGSEMREKRRETEEEEESNIVYDNV